MPSPTSSPRRRAALAPRELTDRSVAALPATGPEGQRDYVVTDTRIAGFGVRVMTGAAGVRKSFLFNYRLRTTGETRRLTLGAFPALSARAARHKARQLEVLVAEGGDPSGARRQSRQEDTVATLGTAFLEEVRQRRKRSTRVEYERLWARFVVPALGARKISGVTTADVRRLHRHLHRTPYQANRVLSLLGAFFTFAEDEGARPRHSSPVRAVKPYPEQGRERFLSAAEVATLGEALATAERTGLPPAPVKRRKPGTKKPQQRPKSADTPKPANPYAVAAIRLLLLTGCREGEILSLRWDAVDLERGFLRLADTKTGKSVRPLGAAAAEILDALPALAGSAYVFPGLKEGKHLTDLSRTWYAVRHAAGLDDVRLHDLRHSFAAVSATGGDSLLVTRALLGHRNVATTAKYSHLADDPVKAAADRASGALAAWLRGAQTPVTPLRREKS